MNNISQPRRAALEVLLRVGEGEHAEAVLVEVAPSDPRDRRLCWHLVLGTLRARGQLDAAIAANLRGRFSKLEPPVREILRLGAFEKLYARTPDHAVVNEYVNLCKSLRGNYQSASRARGLVNAILRKVKQPSKWSPQDELNLPSWLAGRWSQRYGLEATHRWCQQALHAPPLTLVLQRDDDALFEQLGSDGRVLTPVSLWDSVLARAYRLEGHRGPVTELPGFDTGGFWVQDPASVAVADLLQATAGDDILDACAAPGGKTFRMASQGAKITAVDLSAERLELLKDSTQRLGISPQIVTHDWTRGRCEQLGQFNKVLIDAPCSALGLIRRHPEIKWRRTQRDLTLCAQRQAILLATISEHCAPGGTLVYSVCSPEPEEGTKLVQGFLAKHPEFELESSWSTAPPTHDEDAFFAARLKRQ